MDRNTGAGKKKKVLCDFLADPHNKTCNLMQDLGFYQQDHHGNQEKSIVHSGDPVIAIPYPCSRALNSPTPCLQTCEISNIQNGGTSAHYPVTLDW